MKCYNFDVRGTIAAVMTATVLRSRSWAVWLASRHGTFRS